MTGVGDTPRDLEGVLRAQNKRATALERAKRKGVAGALRRIWAALTGMQGELGEIRTNGAAMVGEIKIWPLESAPEGFVVCRGQAVSRSAYPELFALLGTTYGVGDGSTTFNVPNLSGRVPVGFSSGWSEFNQLGKEGGQRYHTLTVAEMPSHSHVQRMSAATVFDGSIRDMGVWESESAPGSPKVPSSGTWASSSQQLTTRSEGGGGAHNNLQPYTTVNFIIKAVAG